jgi:hypothetical protein
MMMAEVRRGSDGKRGYHGLGCGRLLGTYLEHLLNEIERQLGRSDYIDWHTFKTAFRQNLNRQRVDVCKRTEYYLKTSICI